VIGDIAPKIIIYYYNYYLKRNGRIAPELKIDNGQTKLGIKRVFQQKYHEVQEVKH